MNRQKKRKTGTNKQKERCDRTKHFSKGFENDDSDQGKLMIFTQWSNKLVDTFIWFIIWSRNVVIKEFKYVA